MSRFSRISTVWRKEFADTLRDRRTVAAMVLVPMVVYPVLMLGSLMAFEVQVGRLKQEKYTIAVDSEEVAHWLRTRIIDVDPARHPAARFVPAEDVKTAVTAAENASPPDTAEPDSGATEAAASDVRRQPPEFHVAVFDNVPLAVLNGQAHAGILISGGSSLPTPDSSSSVEITLVTDQAEIRSQIATAGLEGILDRANEMMVQRRLRNVDLSPEFIHPIVLREQQVAPPEKVSGSVLGQIVPLILIIMTITGAIYPAIDLTAGERERGTLETLMAAPVPKVDLIAGKFVVVASIGMLSAVLNLLSIGGTIYLGGLGNMLVAGGQLRIPLQTLPIVLLVLIPLAVMFSALLLAVCSFARSFKEAQNYVMPVMMVALIPAVIGVLPGTELEGPLLIMPVTNIVILTRELFMGQIDHGAIFWVCLSTCVYAGAAVAISAKLFGLEAVLFADSASFRTLIQRRFFKVRNAPPAAHALLLVAIVYSLNFFVQQSMAKSGFVPGSAEYLAALALTLVTLFAALPLALSVYLRVRVTPAFSLRIPHAGGFLAAFCFGASTWLLAIAWYAVQEQFLPIAREFRDAARPFEEQLASHSVVTVLFFAALVPAFCEEMFFRGFVLSGLVHRIKKHWAIIVVAFAFAAAHYSVQRFAVTFALGALFCILVVQWRSLWPAVIAHMMHNSMIVLVSREDGFAPALQRLGYDVTTSAYPPLTWILIAAAVMILGVLLSMRAPDPLPSIGNQTENALDQAPGYSA